MSTVRLEAVKNDDGRAQEIPMQPASQDIWDKKYRLKTKKGEPVDADIDDTYQRVAKALADAEPTAEKQEYWYERFLWALRRGAIPAGRITSNAGALEHKPAPRTINCTVSGTIDRLDGRHPRQGPRGRPDAEGRLRHRLRILDAASARRVRRRRRRVHLGPDVASWISTTRCVSPCRRPAAAAARRWARSTSSHPDVKEFIRAKREDGRLRQFNLSLLITDGFMDAVENDGDWPLVFPVNIKEKDDVDLDDPSQVVWREWPTHRQLRQPRRRPGRLQDLRPHPRPAPVGHDHGLDVRLRRAGLHPDRPRQRDEQQLVVREHPRDQPLRRAAAAALRRLPARLGQPDQVRARPVHRQGRASTGRNTRKSCACSPACSTTWSRSTACRCEQQRDEIMRKRRHGMGFLGLGSTVTMLQMKYGSPESCEFTEARRPRDGAWPAGKWRWRWRRRRARADHGRGASPSPPRCCASARKWSKDGWKIGQEIEGSVLHAQVLALHAARGRGRAGAGGRAGRSRRAASPTTARSRRPAPSRCRWPTTPPTASSRASPTTTAAT